MRIALLVQAFGIGGLPNYVLMLARALTDTGFDVLVVHGNVAIPENLEVSGLALMHLPGFDAGSNKPAAATATEKLQAWLPDIVHVHFCTNVAVIDRLLTTNLPLVRTHHEYGSLCLRNGRRRWIGDRCQRPLAWGCAAYGCIVSPPRAGSRLPHIANLSAKLAERNRYRSFDANIVTSDHMARAVLSNGFSEEKMYIVPYFSRFETDATDLIQPAKLPGVPGRDRPFELLFAGQALPVKGLETLVEALTALNGDWHLSVLAEGPRLAPSRAMVEAAGLPSRVSFLGWANQSTTRDYYRLADMLVLPSLWDEPFGMVGIEAMSFGTPVVGFNVGGIPDYLIDEETGLLVKETTASALHDALARIMGDPERVSVWSCAARSLVARTYTRATHVAALHHIYRASIGSHQ